MTEFKLTNGQAIELTKDGVLIKGNRIEIQNDITIVKDDKHASIVESNHNGTNLSVVPIDDEKHDAEVPHLDPNISPRLAALEAKLSTVMAEIDKLKTTIKLERALTDNKITDAVIKARLGE